MKEKITYSSDLKCFFDLCNRADLNNSVAQFDLAKLYLHINRENTNKKAFLLLKKLANKSYNAVQTNAQYMLARCYEKGYGITKTISSLQNGIGKPISMQTMISIKPLKMKLMI